MTDARTPASPDREPPSTGSAPADGAEWTTQVTDLVIDFVDRIHDRTTGPALTASRMVVYGLVALIVGAAVAVTGLVLVSRLLALIPGDIWIPYSALGAILVLAGLYLWSKRSSPA